MADSCGKCEELPSASQDRDLIFPMREGEWDHINHLVQDDKVISHILEEELPPDEYYEELREVLSKRYPEADPLLADHVVSLSAAFDTAAAFALSFGITKFQLAANQVRLVGEYVST